MPTTVAYNSGNYGLANGTAVTATTVSTGNTKFDNVNTGSGGSVTADNAQVIIGSQSLKISPVTAAIGPSWRGTAIPTPIANVSVQGYFWWPGTPPAATWQLCKAYTDNVETAAAQSWSISIGTTGRFIVSDSAAVVSSPATFLPSTAQWLRLDVNAVQGASIAATISQAHSQTPLISVPVTATTAVGVTASFRFGVHSSGTNVTTWLAGWRLGIGPGFYALGTSNLRGATVTSITPGWTAQPSGTLAGVLADDTPTTVAKSPDAPAGAVLEDAGFGLLQPGPCTFTVGGSTSGPDTSRVLQILCGTTVVKTGAAYTVSGTGESSATISLLASDVPLVNDWADLRLRITDTQ